MEFPHEYFDDEIREDFYVSGLMKRLWAADLEVLSDIAKVCEKHNIRWFADYGTLLGAVYLGMMILTSACYGMIICGFWRWRRRNCRIIILC